MSYPAGIRWPANGSNNYVAQAAFDISYDPAAIQDSAVTAADGGTTAAIKFYNEYFEDGTFPGNLGIPFAGMCGAANPAGLNYLERYAAAMAAGNITQIGDGGYGYTLGQPALLRPFMAEYMSLPDIGMQELPSSGDPVALWYGANSQNNRLDFYLVDEADYPVAVTVTFSGVPNIRRLSTGAYVATTDGTMTLTLQPYQLLAFENRSSTAAPTGFSAAPTSPTIAANLSQDLTLVEDMLNNLGNSSSQPAAYAQYVTALNDYNAGEYWGARMALISHQLVAVYETYGVYPPNLYGGLVAGVEPLTPLAPMYELTFDGMTAGNAPSLYNSEMAADDVVPATDVSGVIGQVPVNLLEGTLGGQADIPQIVPSTGPQGGLALSLTAPSSGNVGYLSPTTVNGASSISNPIGATVEMDVDLLSYTNTGLPVGGVSQYGTGGIMPSLFFTGGTTNSPSIEFGVTQNNGTFESVTYAPTTSIVGEWHSIAGVYVANADSTQSRVELWLDGQEVASYVYTKDTSNQILEPGGWAFGVNAPQVANGRVVSCQIDAAAVTAAPLFPGTFILPTTPQGGMAPNVLTAKADSAAAPAVSASSRVLSWAVSPRAVKIGPFPAIGRVLSNTAAVDAVHQSNALTVASIRPVVAAMPSSVGPQDIASQADAPNLTLSVPQAVRLSVFLASGYIATVEPVPGDSNKTVRAVNVPPSIEDIG